MPQFGSDTVILPTMNLVVFDCFETLVYMDQRVYKPRNGVPALLRHLRREHKQITVHSDGARSQVEEALAQSKLRTYFDDIFTADEACEPAADGRLLKRLDLPMDAYGVQPHETVFIGDSPLDAIAAKTYQVHFIRVPRSEDPSFSFRRLIGGASRYSSEVFNDNMLRFYSGGDGKGRE